MTIDDLKAYRDALEIDIEDSRLEENPFIALEEDSDEIKYLTERRTELGGYCLLYTSPSPRDRG